MDTTLLLVGEAARILNLSAGGVRWLVDTGRLRAIRTGGGRGLRLVRADDVARLARERQARAQARAEAGVQTSG